MQDLQVKYEDIEDRMCKEHEAKIKEIAREWENRLRVVEEKIRTAENDNNVLDNETKKQM